MSKVEVQLDTGKEVVPGDSYRWRGIFNRRLQVTRSLGPPSTDWGPDYGIVAEYPAENVRSVKLKE